jgi:hypothetical protein
MVEVTQTAKSCPTAPSIIGERLILDDIAQYLAQAPSGAVRDALVRRRTSTAARLLRVRGYRVRRKLLTLSGLKKALDAKINAFTDKLKEVYNKPAKLLSNPRNNTDLFAALNSLDKTNPAGGRNIRIIRERLILKDIEEYLKAQTPGAEKRLDNWRRPLRTQRRALRRKMYRMFRKRSLRPHRSHYSKLAKNLIVKNSSIDLQSTLCQLDPCRSICPAISSVTPSKVKQGQETTLVIKGGNLPNHPKVSIYPSQGIQVLEVKRTNPEKIELKIKVDPKAAKGRRIIKLSSWGNLFSTMSTFTVLEFKTPKLPKCKDAFAAGMQAAMKAAGNCE